MRNIYSVRRICAILVILGLAAISGATYRRPDHKPPALPVLTEAQKTDLQKLQKVVGEVGTVPVRTGAHPDTHPLMMDSSASKNISGIALPSRTGSQTGARVLRQAESDLTNKKHTWLSKLPTLAGVIAFLLILAYVAIRIVDKRIPYRPKRRRKAAA